MDVRAQRSSFPPHSAEALVRSRVCCGCSPSGLLNPWGRTESLAEPHLRPLVQRRHGCPEVEKNLTQSDGNDILNIYGVTINIGKGILRGCNADSTSVVNLVHVLRGTSVSQNTLQT